jgi:hypothetical protein
MSSTTPKETFQTTMVAHVAGEDLRPGNFVTIASEQIELPSFLWSCSGGFMPADELVRLSYLPVEAGLPYKVKAICLPFVYAERVTGKLTTLDTRQKRLVRLDQKVGRDVWKRLKASNRS